MASRKKKIGDSRSSERFALQCTIILASGMQVGEGQTLNMSEGGCLAQSSLPVKVGDILQLRLCLHESEPSMRVSRAAVCWVQGLRFGVKFIGIEEKDRARLNRYVALLGGIHGRELSTSSGPGNVSLTVSVIHPRVESARKRADILSSHHTSITSQDAGKDRRSPLVSRDAFLVSRCRRLDTFIPSCASRASITRWWL